MILELFARNVEAGRELVRVELGLAALAARVEEVGEQRLQDAEPLRGDRRCGALGAVGGARHGFHARELRRLALVRLANAAQALGTCHAQLVRLERDGTPILAQDPARERLDVGVLGLEDSVRERAGLGQRPVHPPRRVTVDLDARHAGDRPVLPLLSDAVRVDVEVGRPAEVALAPGREADVAADPGDAEGTDGVVALS